VRRFPVARSPGSLISAPTGAIRFISQPRFCVPDAAPRRPEYTAGTAKRAAPGFSPYLYEEVMHQHAPRPNRARYFAAAAIAAVALAACSDSPSGPRIDDPQAAINFQRLLVTDAQAPSARLIALHNDSTVENFTLAAPASLVYHTHSGRFAAVQQRTADRVQFVDGGVWTDAGQGHRRAASLLGFHLADGLPTHENVTGDWISVFFDGSGIARWMRESDKLSGSPRIAHEIATGAAHHGGSFTVAAGTTPFFAYTVPNPAGGLPVSVAVQNQAGQVVAEADCPAMHGNNSIATGGVFGCNNGMVVVRPSGSTVTAQHVTMTGEMAGLGLRNAWTGRGGTFILGQFAALPGQPTRRVLAIIDPATGSVNPLPALPAGVVDHWRAVEPVKGQVAMLGTDGNLYVFSGTTRQLQHTVANVVPALPASGAMTHQVVAAEDIAAVASPSTGEVVLLNLSTGTVIRRINVGGAPSRLALLGAQAAGQFIPAQ
jgi:hypothetical protein